MTLSDKKINQEDIPAQDYDDGLIPVTDVKAFIKELKKCSDADTELMDKIDELAGEKLI